MLVLRLRRRGTRKVEDYGLDDQMYSLTEATALLDTAIATGTELSLLLENGELLPFQSRSCDLIALVEQQHRGP